MPVYLVTNLTNNQYYVGKTKQKLYDRWSSHKRDASSPEGSYKSYFHRAIRKYGIESFNIQTLSDGSNLSDTQLKNLEKVWIILLQANNSNFGYNLTNGGDGIQGYKYTEKQRQAQSEMMKKKMENPEYRKWLGQLQKGRTARNKGKTMSVEYRATTSAGLRKYWASVDPEDKNRFMLQIRSNRKKRGE